MRYIDTRVASGDFNNASELVRAAVRLLRKQEPVVEPVTPSKS
ncbi:type II toxin-antitoxin system ParD family antitoxin [Sphingomonas sp. BAUL-RG-20F-R05-02]